MKLMKVPAVIAAAVESAMPLYPMPLNEKSPKTRRKFNPMLIKLIRNIASSVSFTSPPALKMAFAIITI